MDVQLTGDATVFKPDGKRLLILRRGAIAKDLVEAAYPTMYELRTLISNNRGSYGASQDLGDGSANKLLLFGKVKRLRLKNDGTLSKTTIGLPVRSAVVGYYDRYPRIPYCRETAFVTREPELWGRALPFISAVGELFRATVPDREAAQAAQASKTHPAYVLPGTSFTTITVNNTMAGAYHTDKGDYEPGFGVMALFRKGHYRGAHIVFPEWGVGADLQHGDVIFFDAHDVHGNIPFHDSVGREGVDWVRISMVFYYRAKMIDCLAPELEMQRAKRRGSGITFDR
jgi:hypothetical protein